MKCDAALEAGVAAGGAAASAIKRDFSQPILGEVFQERLPRGIVGFLAVFADAGGETLGENADDRRRDHKAKPLCGHDHHERRIFKFSGTTIMTGLRADFQKWSR